MPNNDPGALVKRLAERLRDEAAKVGLTLRGFSFMPDLEGDGPPTVQAAFTLDVEAEMADDTTIDQDAINAEFDRMMAADRDAARHQEAKEALERRLAEGGDLLDDDD